MATRCCSPPLRSRGPQLEQPRRETHHREQLVDARSSEMTCRDRKTAQRVPAAAPSISCRGLSARARVLEDVLDSPQLLDRTLPVASARAAAPRAGCDHASGRDEPRDRSGERRLAAAGLARPVRGSRPAPIDRLTPSTAAVAARRGPVPTQTSSAETSACDRSSSGLEDRRVVARPHRSSRCRASVSSGRMHRHVRSSTTTSCGPSRCAGIDAVHAAVVEDAAAVALVPGQHHAGNAVEPNATRHSWHRREQRLGVRVPRQSRRRHGELSGLDDLARVEDDDAVGDDRSRPPGRGSRRGPRDPPRRRCGRASGSRPARRHRDPSSARRGSGPRRRWPSAIARLTRCCCPPLSSCG